MELVLNSPGSRLDLQPNAAETEQNAYDYNCAALKCVPCAYGLRQPGMCNVCIHLSSFYEVVATFH